MKSLRGRVSAKSTPGAGNGRWSTAIRGRWLAVEHPAPAESNGTIQSLDLGRSMLKHSLLGYQLSRRCWPLHLGKFGYISWASRGNVYLSTLIRKEESELPRMMHITTFWVPDRNRGLTLLVREKYKALSIKKDTPQTAAAATLHFISTREHEGLPPTKHVQGNENLQILHPSPLLSYLIWLFDALTELLQN